MTAVDGILLIYHRQAGDTAATVMDHVNAFRQYSSFPVWSVNISEGFPIGLRDLRFKVVVLHYSLFGTWPHIPERDEFLTYVAECDSYKIAFFQDEHQHCQERFALLDDCGIAAVFSLLDPSEVPGVYGRHTSVRAVHHTLTGYVSDGLVDAARRLTKEPQDRSIDVGYRARPLAFFMGRAAQEKTGIADEFKRRAAGRGLTLDIATAEEDRIYGDDWYRFIADCKAMLGVEAGVSVFDLDGSARLRCEALLAANPESSFEEASKAVLHEYEDRVFYRTISPRVFEAAAFRTCLVLFEGRYNDILEPMSHFIPLKKDYSNFEQVLETLNDADLVREITDRAYRDLIGSGSYSFRAFIEDFDQRVLDAVGPMAADRDAERRVRGALARGRWRRLLPRRLRQARRAVFNRLHQPFPGKALLRPILKPIAARLFRS